MICISVRFVPPFLPSIEFLTHRKSSFFTPNINLLFSLSIKTSIQAVIIRAGPPIGRNVVITAWALSPSPNSPPPRSPLLFVKKKPHRVLPSFPRRLKISIFKLLRTSAFARRTPLFTSCDLTIFTFHQNSSKAGAGPEDLIPLNNHRL
jgi:hypothetical protein